jgi:hypothetical protein
MRYVIVPLQIGERALLPLRFERQMAALGIAHQPPLALQVPADPLADPLYQRLQLLR